MTRKTAGSALRALMVAAAALAICGCSALGMRTASVSESIKAAQDSFSPKVSAPAILQSGTLTVGIPSSAGAPYVVSDGDAVDGMSIDMASLVAQELGLKVSFVSVSDPEQAVGKTCDVVMGISDGDYDGVTAVGSYAEKACGVFRKGEAGTISASDLEGKAVAVQSGSVSASTLSTASVSVQERDYANLDEAFDALEDGSVDYVLGSAYPCAYLAAQHEGVSLCGTLDAPKAIGIGVASTNQALQEAVEQALASAQSGGAEGIVRARWVGGMEDLDASDQIQGITFSESSRSSSSSSATLGSSSASATGSRSYGSSPSAGDEDGVSASGAQDGSTAGANAVVPTGASSSSSSSY